MIIINNAAFKIYSPTKRWQPTNANEIKSLTN